MKTRTELYEAICDVALDVCNNAWKIERLDNILADLNEWLLAPKDINTNTITLSKVQDVLLDYRRLTPDDVDSIMRKMSSIN